MIWGIAYNVFLLACCAFAGVFGRTPERIGIAFLLAATHAPCVVYLALTDADAFEAWVVGSDIVLLLALVFLALRVDRYWPLWAAGFQLAGLATHLATLVRGVSIPTAYGHSLMVWACAVLAAMVVGTWLEVVLPRRAKRRP